MPKKAKPKRSAAEAKRQSKPKQKKAKQAKAPAQSTEEDRFLALQQNQEELQEQVKKLMEQHQEKLQEQAKNHQEKLQEQAKNLKEQVKLGQLVSSIDSSELRTALHGYAVDSDHVTRIISLCNTHQDISEPDCIAQLRELVGTLLVGRWNALRSSHPSAQVFPPPWLRVLLLLPKYLFPSTNNSIADWENLEW
jgi:signal recognition particle GTPase